MAVRGIQKTARQPTLALGMWLAVRGPLEAAGLVLIVLGALACIAVAVALRSEGARSASLLPTLGVPLIAWLAGGTFAFGVAFRAIRRDREGGIVELARARGVSAAAYGRGRVGGLVAVLACSLGGAALVAAIAATAVATPTPGVLRAGLAGMVYALAFSATVGPLALAALGTRSRLWGYVTLLLVLALPELIAPWTEGLLPAGWHELTSIPAALDAVRDGVVAPYLAGAHAARALAALAAVVIVSLLIVDASIGRRLEAGR